MMKGMPAIFLSYAGKDREIAQSVGRELSKAGFRVWDQALEILPGADWAAEISSALRSAEAMLVFISPDFMASDYVSRDIQYALGAKHLRDRLIPIVIRPTKDMPWILNSLTPLKYEDPRKTGQQVIQLLNHPANVSKAKHRAS